MTREEKARAYDKALERAKEMITAMTNKGGVAKIDDIQYLFSELAESEDERIRREMIYWLKGFIGEEEGCGCTEGEIRERIAYLERQKAKENYDRMAPIYKNKESFESALEKAWKFYNDSGSSTVDGCEDNAIELAFAKGFREGFLCEKAQNIRVDKLIPSWDEERQAVYIPIINKYLDAKCSEKAMTWDDAMAYAKKVGKELPSQHEMFAILLYKTEINEILKEHSGDLLTEWAWSSTEVTKHDVWYVNFVIGYVQDNNKGHLSRVRTISD